MRRTSWVGLLLSFALCAFSSLVAQRFTGTITGVVTDSQGALVAGAQVTVTNQATGASRTLTTNGAGVYTASSLDVGVYTVRVKSANFKESVVKDVTVDTASTASVNAVLQVGNTNEEVTVEGTAIQVETTNGSVGNVINGTEVRELPLNGNNFIELTQLVPGVSALSSFNVEKKGLEGGVDFSVNGNLVTGNLYLVDGVNNNDIGSNRTILIYPSIQAIDEFKILRNSYTAEYGQAAGAIISIVTRSGTNQWHGGAWYSGRNTVLNATDWFTKQAESSNPLIHKDVNRRNDYLFNIEGPIVKDKLFIFESEEWNKEVKQTGVRLGQVPTLAERAGDFSAPAPASTGGCNNVSVSPSYTNAGAPAGTPTFAGNVIPQGALSEAGLLYMGNFPLPNLPTAVNCANWAGSLASPDNWREDNVRGDWKITPTLTMMGRYTRDTWDQPFPSTNEYWGEDIWPAVEDHWQQPSSQATIKITKLLGATATNDLQVSFAANAINVTRTGEGVGGNYWTLPDSTSGLNLGCAGPGLCLGPKLSANAFVAAVNTAMPTYFPLATKQDNGIGEPGFWSSGIIGARCISGSACSSLADQGPWHNNEQLLILTDNFSKVFGSHTFKAGFLASNNQKNQRNQNESLGNNAAFWSGSALNPGAGTPGYWGQPGTVTSGNGVFDMINAGTQWGGSEPSADPFVPTRWHDYEFYGADNFKLRRNVTLDYGVRWSFLRNAYNATGQFGWWEPNLFNATLTDAAGNPQVNSPCNGMLLTSAGVAHCRAIGLAGGAVGHDTGLVPNNNHLIQPRIGIAWDVKGDGKTAVRAGFGTFYNRFMLNTAFAASANPPFVFNSAWSNRQFGPAPAYPCGANTLCAAGVLGTAPTIGIAQNDHIPETLQYNLTIEHELANNTKLEIGYVGNQGRFLEAFINADAPTTLANRIAYAESGDNTSSLLPIGSLTGWKALPFGGFVGVSHYDALQALFKTRIKVVDAQFAYTYSKSLSNTDISDSSGGLQTNSAGGGTFLLGNQPHGSYGPSVINRPQILVGSLVYNAPRLDGRGAFMRTSLGGWEVSSILQYTSGNSITVFSSAGDIIGDGEGAADRPNLVKGQSCNSNLGENHFLNPGKFTIDHYAVGFLPSSPRGVCLGPGLANTDFSLGKTFKISERVNMKFHMDFFNLFNKAQFRSDSVNYNLSSVGSTICNTPGGCVEPSGNYAQNTVIWNPANGMCGGTSCAQSNFGQATTDRGPRIMQYGLRVEF